MKDQSKTEIRVGIMVIVGIIVFLWILGWAKNFSFVSNERDLTIDFKNVAGLEVGDNVTVNGVREGYVKNMTVEGDRVNVVISINNKLKLKSDAVFSVSMLDLMGGKRVEIIPGKSETELDYNKTQHGLFAADIPSVMSFVGNMQEDLSTTLKEIQVTLSSLNKYLQDDKFNREVKNSVSNLSNATQQLNNILTENRSNIKELLKNSNLLSQSAEKFITENKGDLGASIKKLNIVLSNADSLLGKMNFIADQTVSKKNSIGRLLNDDEFFKSLNQSLKQIRELTNFLIEELKNDGIKVDAHISVF